MFPRDRIVIPLPQRKDDTVATGCTLQIPLRTGSEHTGFHWQDRTQGAPGLRRYTTLCACGDGDTGDTSRLNNTTHAHAFAPCAGCKVYSEARPEGHKRHAPWPSSLLVRGHRCTGRQTGSSASRESTPGGDEQVGSTPRAGYKKRRRHC